MLNKQSALVAFLVLSVAAVDAQVTYVDAVVDTNTFATDGTLSSVWYNASGGSSQDATRWAERTDPTFGNGNTILQAHGGASGNFKELTTTIDGLTANVTYEIYAFFWDASGGEAWALDAGLSTGVYTNYIGSNTNGQVSNTDGFAADLTYTNGIMLLGDNNPENTIAATGNRDLLYGIVGTAVANIDGEIDVFIQNTRQSSISRSWYDGVGFKQVPEPSAYALIGGLCALAVAMMRRRR